MPFTRNGYGQVEPNQLSAQKTGQIYASLPLDTNVKVLQNGEFMYYDYAAGKVSADDSTGIAEPMLVFNEIKLYEPFWRTSYKDFAMIRVGDNYITSTYNGAADIANAELPTAGIGGGADTIGNVPSTTNPPSMINSTGHVEDPYRMDGFAPRLFKTNIGDIMTTNMVKVDGTVDYANGEYLVPVKNTTSKTLVLEKFDTTGGAKPTGMAWVVIKKYTMPDGQDGLKLQRVQ